MPFAPANGPTVWAVGCWLRGSHADRALGGEGGGSDRSIQKRGGKPLPFSLPGQLYHGLPGHVAHGHGPWRVESPAASWPTRYKLEQLSIFSPYLSSVLGTNLAFTWVCKTPICLKSLSYQNKEVLLSLIRFTFWSEYWGLNPCSVGLYRSTQFQWHLLQETWALDCSLGIFLYVIIFIITWPFFLFYDRNCGIATFIFF